MSQTDLCDRQGVKLALPCEAFVLASVIKAGGELNYKIIQLHGPIWVTDRHSFSLFGSQDFVASFITILFIIDCASDNCPSHTL
jgi:hypothetical protein